MRLAAKGINVRELGRQYKDLSDGELKRATSQGMNRGVRKVRGLLVKEIAVTTGGKQKEARAETKIHTAKPKNLNAEIVGSHRTRNLVQQLTKAKRSRSFWRARRKRYAKGKGNSSSVYKRKGIKAKGWGRFHLYEGYFIMSGQGGAPIVADRVKESGKMLRFPYGISYGKALRSPRIQARAQALVSDVVVDAVDARIHSLLGGRGA